MSTKPSPSAKEKFQEWQAASGSRRGKVFNHLIVSTWNKFQTRLFDCTLRWKEFAEMSDELDAKAMYLEAERAMDRTSTDISARVGGVNADPAEALRIVKTALRDKRTQCQALGNEIEVMNKALDQNKHLEAFNIAVGPATKRNEPKKKESPDVGVVSEELEKYKRSVDLLEGAARYLAMGIAAGEMRKAAIGIRARIMSRTKELDDLLEAYASLAIRAAPLLDGDVAPIAADLGIKSQPPLCLEDNAIFNASKQMIERRMDELLADPVDQLSGTTPEAPQKPNV